MNDNGTAAGNATKYAAGIGVGYRAVRWDASGTIPTELGNLGTDAISGYTYAIAHALNDAGTAVGYAYKVVSGSGQRAVRWDASGTAATELGSLGTNANGFALAAAYAVNGSGTAVGYSEKYVGGSNKGNRAVRWDSSGTAATEPGNLGTDSSGVTSAIATALNDGGTTVGWSLKYTAGSSLGQRAVRWDASGTAATELGSLGTSAGGATFGNAYAVNGGGTVVGISRKFVAGKNVGDRAVRWDATGTAATELGNLGTDASGTSNSSAYAVDDAGAAVGYCHKYVASNDVGTRAVIWGLDGKAIDLNDFGIVANPADGTWLLIEADAISDNGWVAGIGTFTPSGGAPYTRGWVAQLNLLPGDYNGNGIVDAADYTVWHDHLGQNFSLQNRDPNASGEINGTDYDFWVSHFGDTGSGAGSTAGQASSGTQAGVPEPSTMSLMVVAMTGCIVRMAARPALRRRVAKGGLPR